MRKNLILKFFQKLEQNKNNLIFLFEINLTQKSGNVRSF